MGMRIDVCMDSFAQFVAVCRTSKMVATVTRRPRRGSGSVTKRWLSSHDPAYVQRATPGCAPRDDHTQPTVPPLLSARPAFIRVLGPECTAPFLLRFLRRTSGGG